jgi:hypothetical protein
MALGPLRSNGTGGAAAASSHPEVGEVSLNDDGTVEFVTDQGAFLVMPEDRTMYVAEGDEWRKLDAPDAPALRVLSHQLGELLPVVDDDGDARVQYRMAEVQTELNAWLGELRRP